MGSGSTKLGAITGHWFNKRPIYEHELDHVQAGIKSGKYVPVAPGSIPHTHELWFTLQSANGPVHYARASDFKAWWFAHSAALLKRIEGSTKADSAMVARVASVAVPVLLDADKASAKKLAAGHFAPSEHATVNRIIDQLAGAIPDVSGATGAPYSAVGQAAGEHRANTAGTSDFYGNVHKSAYFGAAERAHGKSGGFDFVGGCSCRGGGFIGAAELDLTTVADYADSANSKTKATIVDDLAKVYAAMGYPIAGPTHADKIKQMIAALPANARVPSADDKQRKLCASVAKAINKVYGNEIIGETLPPEVICQQIAEILSSLGAGLYSEFLAVFTDVKRVLKNLHVLKDTLAQAHKQIVDKLKGSSDATLAGQLAQANDLHTIITDEIERQTQMLANLLNITLLPSDKALSKLISESKSLHTYVDKIDVRTGSDRFGKVIGDVMRGLGVTANFAQLIEKALHVVGMKIADYNASGSVAALREKITAGLLGKQLNEADLHEYLKAAELLYKNFYRADAIDEARNSVTGSAEVYPKTNMERRVADRTKLRNLIFTTFYRQINGVFDSLVLAIDALTAEVGGKIPLSEALNSLRMAFSRINEGLVRNKNIYYALIGYYNDALSKSKRDELIGDLNMVSSFIDVLLEMPLYASGKSYFVAIQTHIKGIISLIDRFTDEITAKFGRGEAADTADRAGGCETSGGDAELDAMLSERTAYRPTKTIAGAINQFDYKYRVAQIKSNLAAASVDLASYGEKYDKIVAESIASILADEAKSYERLRDELKSDDRFGAIASYVDTAAPIAGFAKPEEVKAQRKAALEVLESQWETKKRFWATVEAVDTYMRVFTDALVRNPQDVKEIKSMIESVEVISDWYTEGTGENLSSVFDHFPSMIAGDGVAAGSVTMPPDEYRSEADSGAAPTHYYQRIANALNGGAGKAAMGPAASLPGNPYLVTTPVHALGAKAAAKKTLSGLAVLKNLLSVFVHVGSKFGGQELRSKVFMTPMQMYNNLVDYLHNSAFAQGFGTGTFTPAKMPDEFMSSERLSVAINMADGAIIDWNTAVGQRVVPALPGMAPNPPQPLWSVQTSEQHLGRIQLGVATVNNVAFVDAYHEASSIAQALTVKINSAIGNGAVPGTAKQSWGSDLPKANRVQLFKKRWGVWMRSVIPGLKELEGFSFQREDEYFVLVMKALSAKILTVVGMYDVFDRPMEFNGLSPIRMIIGGDDTMPKIIDEAVALYLRLPLLAQFYRGIFGFDGPDDEPNSFRDYSDWRARDQSVKISMIPDIEGVFSGLIRLIFRKNRFIDGAVYADNDVAELIREVNLIYQRMAAKHSADVITGTINEFVAEMNRRYGVLSRTERNTYEKEFGYQYEYGRGSTADRYDTAPDAASIALLPGEDTDEIIRPSGAQRLLGETFDLSSKDRKSQYAVTDDHRKIVYRFRCAIDKYFSEPDESTSFTGTIRAVQTKLKSEQNDAARFKLIAEMVRGGDVYSKTDGMKQILFHETVVSGLNLLSGVHSMLARFKQRVMTIDLAAMEDLIIGEKGYLNTVDKKSLTGLRDHIVKELTDNSRLAEDNDPETVLRVSKLLGLREGADKFSPSGTDMVLSTTSLPEGDGIVANTARWAHDNAGQDAKAFAVIDWDGTPPAGGAAVDPGIKNVGKGLYITTGAGITDPVADGAVNAAERTGLTSILLGFSVQQLREAWREKTPTAKNADARAAIETLMRFVFARSWVMNELIETTFGLGNDFQSLVSVKLDEGRFMINYGGLKDLIIDMFAQVHYFMDLLRPHINTEEMAKYTDKYQPGSYYWLQEQLMEKIIHGRPAEHENTGRDSKNLAIGYANLDQLTSKLTYTYNQLTRVWPVNGAGIRTGAIATVSRVPGATSYARLFAADVFYDAEIVASGLTTSAAAPDASRLGAATSPASVIEFQRNPYDGLHLAGQPGSRVLDTRYVARFKQLYSWTDELTYNRSALFAFNQLVAKYIQAFYDPVSSKIYSSAITQFATGEFSRAITDQLYTYPDTVPGKFVGIKEPGNMPVGTDVALITATRPEFRAYHDTLKEMVLELLTYGENGLGPNGGILVTNALPTMSFWNADGAQTTASGVYAYLLMYTVAHLIAAILTALKNVAGNANNAAINAAIAALQPAAAMTAPQLAAAFLLLGLGERDLAAGTLANPATLTAARTLYGGIAQGVDVTFADVLPALLQGGAAVITARIGDAFNVHTGPSSMPFTNGRDFQLNDRHAAAIAGPPGALGAQNRGAPMAILLGMPAVSNRAGAGAAATVPVAGVAWVTALIGSRINVINEVLSWSPTWAPLDAGSISLTASMAMPSSMLNSMLTGTPTEVAYKLNLYTAALIRCADVCALTPSAAVIPALKGVVDGAMTARSVYSPNASTIRSSTLVKQDDLNVVSLNQFADSVFTPTSEVSYILIAHGGGDKHRDLASLGIADTKPHTDPASDTIAGLTTFGSRADPDGDHVLFTSLAVIIRNLIATKNNAGTSPVYIQENVADVTSYMKEKMRGNMPSFRNLFNALAARCEYLKRFIGAREMNLTRAVSPGKGIHNPWPYVLNPVTVDSTATADRFIGILDSIVRGCQAFSKSCDACLREIGDDPKYLEIHQGSIKEYRAQYGVDPLMPLSSALVLLKNTTHAAFMPVHSRGETDFKIMYGLRALIGQPTAKPLGEHIVGFAQIVEQFNLTIDTKLQADKGRADAFLNAYVRLLRYVYELKHVKGNLTPYVLTTPGMINRNTLGHRAAIEGLFTRDDLVLTKFAHGSSNPRGNMPVKSPYADGVVQLSNRATMSIVDDQADRVTVRGDKRVKYNKPAYAIATTLPEVVKMTESSFRDEKIKDLVMYMTTRQPHKHTLAVQNIVDLNIVPINVHALMRDIPLANLYNYAYTLDRLIIELYYGLKNDSARKLIVDLCDEEGVDDGSSANRLKNITSAKDMLVALLLKPYMKVFDAAADAPGTTYARFVKPMLNGAANAGELGRPKFLSDQIFNKAIFGQMYASRSSYGEVGPSAVNQPPRFSRNDITDMIYIVLAANAGAGQRFAGRLFNPATPGEAAAVRKLVTVALDANSSNPSMSLSALLTKFTALAAPADVAAANFVSPAFGQLMVCVVTKLVYGPLSHMMAQGLTTPAELVRGAQCIALLLRVLDRVAGRVGEYLGLYTDPSLGGAGAAAAAPANAPADANAAIAAAIDAMVDAAGAHVAGAPTVAGLVPAPVDAATLAVRGTAMGNDVVTNTWEIVIMKVLHQLFDISVPTTVASATANVHTAAAFTANQVHNSILVVVGRPNPQRGAVESSDPMFEDNVHLHWLDRALGDNPPDNENVLNDAQIRRVDVSAIKDALAHIGRLRFDTVFIRNLVFIVNLYRSIRMKLQRDLSYSKDIIARAEPITRANLTEFFGNQTSHSSHARALAGFGRKY